MFADPKPETLGIAGFAVVSALIDLLVERQLITADEARAVYRNAQGEVRNLVGVAGADASALIESVRNRLA